MASHAHAGPPTGGRRRLDAHPAFGDPLKDARQELVFLGEDSLAELCLVVVLLHGHRSLRDDRAGVRSRVDEVHRTARDADAVGEGLPLGVNARKGGKQGRMDVYHPRRKSFEKNVRQEAHEPGEDDGFDAALAQDPSDGLVEWTTVDELSVVDDDGFDSSLSGSLERWGPIDVGHDDRHARVQRPRGDGVEDGLQVRPTPRDEHAEHNHSGHSTRSSKARSKGTRMTSPRVTGVSPREERVAQAWAASFESTTKRKPMPPLNVRRISLSVTPPPCWTSSKTGGRAHWALTRTPSPSGRTRGRLPGIPPPVMWLMA